VSSSQGQNFGLGFEGLVSFSVTGDSAGMVPVYFLGADQNQRCSALCAWLKVSYYVDVK